MSIFCIKSVASVVWYYTYNQHMTSPWLKFHAPSPLRGHPRLERCIHAFSMLGAEEIDKLDDAVTERQRWMLEKCIHTDVVLVVSNSNST